MIPSADDVLAGVPFLARRHGLPGDYSERAIRAALEDARQRAGGDELAEPAALFFAFARRPRAVQGGWRVLPVVLARAQAHRLGVEVPASTAELRSLCVDVAARRIHWPALRAWFAERLRPRS